MKNIFLYMCYLMRRFAAAAIRLFLALAIPMWVCVSLSACTPRDSGLYRVSVEDGAEDGATDVRTEDGDADVRTEGDAMDVRTEDDTSQASSEAVTVLLEEDDAPAVIYVHVCGAVNAPGVYEMEQGDRVFNAVDAANGFTDEAATDYVNLAQEVADGMKITIPTVNEAEEMADGGPSPLEYAGTGSAFVTGVPGDGAATVSQASGSGTAPDSGSAAVGLININTADEAALTSITGIGPTRAKAIIAYREQNGAFGSIEDIRNVSGIGDSTFNKMKDEIKVK